MNSPRVAKRNSYSFGPWPRTRRHNYNYKRYVYSNQWHKLKTENGFLKEHQLNAAKATCGSIDYAKELLRQLTKDKSIAKSIRPK